MAIRQYASLFRIRLVNGLQYRTVLFGDLFMRLCWALMEILAFTAVYRFSKSELPLTLPQTVAYIWLGQCLRPLFLVVFGDVEIYSAIRTGGIAYQLVRPIGLYGRWFFEAAAGRVASTLLSAAPVLLLAFFLPDPLRLVLPSPGQFLLFLPSLTLAICVTCAVAMLLYVSLFFIISERGLRIIVTAVTTFLAGDTIPLPFFPEALQRIVRLLPFSAMQNVPLQIYSGSLSGVQALEAMALQVFWVTALTVLGQLSMRRALRHVVAMGG